MKNEDKFTYKAGDIEVKMSQCAWCINNTGDDSCAVYGSKPDKYAFNKKTCPSFKKE